MSISSANAFDGNDEKKDFVHIQVVTTENVVDPQLRVKAERALTRKIDLRLMPMFALIYMMNHIDRSSISAARLQGLEEDLRLSGMQYNALLAIFSVSYSTMQIPGNMILNKISRPSIFIGTCVIIWGIASALTGITRNYTGIMLCRVFLGVPEAAFHPGATYLLSRWYTRKQLTFRTGLLFCGNLVSSAFGSLMAAGILGRMEGKGGMSAWRWLFFIEGAITVIVGLMTLAVLPDYPHNTRWLSASESQLAQVRLAEETGEADHDTPEDSAWAGLKMAIMDVKVPCFMMMLCSHSLGTSFTNFFPTLTATLGFSTTITLLLTAAPSMFAAVLCIITTLNADRTGDRFLHISCWWLVGVSAYIISLSTMAVEGRYFSLFLMAAAGTATPLTTVWVTNAFPRPPAKRAAAIGLVHGFGNVGQIMGSFIWKAQWGPTYHKSMLIALSALVLSTAIGFVLRQIFIRANRALDAQELHALKGPNRERVEEFARLKDITFEEALVRKKGFRYLY